MLCSLLLISCAESGDLVPVYERDLLAYNDTTVTLSTSPHDSIDILYTGCGGLVIGHAEQGFLTDPYFTGHMFTPKNLFGICAERKNEEKVLDAIRKKVMDPKKIRTVFISHSHYDHLEDLPGLLSNNDLADTVRVVGSKSTFATINNFLGGHVFVDTDDLIAADTWLAAAPGMSVYVMRSEHAPHFYLGIAAMDGETDEDDFKDFDEPFERTNPLLWREGGTFSYLVDIFHKNETDTFRIFIQQTASNAAIGFPPEDLLHTKKVDLAVLCYASYPYVKFYPDSLLNYLKPKKTIFIHWEDFFADLYREDPDVVPMSAQSGFMKRIHRVRHMKGEDLSKFILFPRPLTRVRVTY